MQFARRDYQHRARLGALDEPSRRQWLTVPTRLPQGRQTLIRDALIVDPGMARRKTMGMLRQHYGAGPHWPALAELLDRVLDAFDTGRVAAVATVSPRLLLDLLGWQGQGLIGSNLPSRPGRCGDLSRTKAFCCPLLDCCLLARLVRRLEAGAGFEPA
ncbi:WbqC family protein [Streptomyces rubrogriseus]|uniref:WbqC family protein n=1 Tax=Streptomyces rubrogriseus TaxID=194673 RepID=A0A6G3TT41_9ACTN|nr:WbqC family protein [Streptomyces rubrogriseus]NEC39635.1 WbqC family protein [Streptomyces rubrogriseus]